MNIQKRNRRKNTLGIVGFGAFGQLAAQHLREYFELSVYDPIASRAHAAQQLGVGFSSMDAVSRCDVVLIASPVASFEDVVGAIAAACRPGALIVDVGSVKVQPSEIMHRVLPGDVEIIATHPLFGPQSARNDIKGLKIAVCPIRGTMHARFAAFLRKSLGLKVVLTTPEAHDKEAAMVQGLTHLIAKVLSNMGPLPTLMTTKSFELLSEAVAMVQYDAPEVFEAIEKANPYAENVRRRFFDLSAELNRELESRCDTKPRALSGH